MRVFLASPMCMHVSPICVPGACGGQKGVPDLPVLELEVSCQVGAGNWCWVLWKSRTVPSAAALLSLRPGDQNVRIPQNLQNRNLHFATRAEAWSERMARCWNVRLEMWSSGWRAPPPRGPVPFPLALCSPLGISLDSLSSGHSSLMLESVKVTVSVLRFLWGKKLTH